MSQAKVDRYKEEKKNRQKIMKKQKLENALLKLGGTLVAVALVGWLGFSVYQTVTSSKDAVSNTYSVDTAAVDEYLNGLSKETETEEAAETEAPAETEGESDSTEAN